MKRTIEKRECGMWIRCPMKNLKKGNWFRIFEPNGYLVGEFVADSNARQESDGVWIVEVDGGNNEEKS